MPYNEANANIKESMPPGVPLNSIIPTSRSSLTHIIATGTTQVKNKNVQRNLVKQTTNKTCIAI